MKLPVIGFCGMTHLGLNSAVASAARGFDIVCYDTDVELIKQLDEGVIAINEPELEELYHEHRKHLKFISDVSILAGCDIAYIASDVPTDDQGKSDLIGIDKLIRKVEPELNEEAILVILSQVSPGFTRQYYNPIRTIYYQVETLIFGRAIERAMHPERFIIGCADPDDSLEITFKLYLEAFKCPILPMRYESAELAKISINMCLVASISVANTMAEICEHVGADWSEIIPSLRLDKRIGEYSYIVPGLGISGGNLERDLASVISMADQYETDNGVVKAWINNSNYRKTWPFKVLKNEVLDDNPNSTVCMLGLAYKENTHSTKNSPALALLHELNAYSVNVYDPIVDNIEVASNIMMATDMESAIKGADVLIIMTAWDDFRSNKISDLKSLMAGNVLIDPYCILDGKEAVKQGMKYITLGVS